MGKLRTLFMTASDMNRWFVAAEQILGWKVKFVESGLFDTPQVEYPNCDAIPNFGISTSGDLRDNHQYLIFPATATVVQEAFQANDGRTRYRCYPIKNPGTVVFEPSGVCSPTHIVTGDFGTVLKDEVSVLLYKTLAQVLRKQCTISGTAAVGAEALALHFAGYRLNDRLSALPQTDLVIRKPRNQGNQKDD
jgi:hypothetical protein